MLSPSDLITLKNKYDVWILEDSCHSPGASFNDGEQIFRAGDGKYADCSIFSFHPVKHIATGEGGMITTSNEDIFKKSQLLRSHGITKDPNILVENHGGWYYEMQDLGYNYRISDIQCALGISQLNRLSESIEKRNIIAKKYKKELSSLPIRFQEFNNNYNNAYHLFVLRTSKRKALYDYLRTKGIFTQVHYIPVHLSPYYKRLGWTKGDLPNAETYYEECLSLPMFPSLKEEEINHVIESVKQFFHE